MSLISASFTWTPEELRRMRGAWLRYTRNGRTHRRNVWILFVIGATGLIAGTVLLVRDGFNFPEVMLTVAFSVVLGFLYLQRMRPTQEVLSRTRERWSIGPNRIIIECGTEREEFEWSHLRSVIRTPDGFLMRRSNGFEIWLPQSAIAQSVEEFTRIAKSKVEKHENAA